MQMLGEDDGRVDREGKSFSRRFRGGAQGIDVIDKRSESSIREGYGEEIGASRNEVSSVPDHA